MRLVFFFSVMLGVLCVRPPKPWILNSISFYHHYHAVASSSSSHHFHLDDRWRRRFQYDHFRLHSSQDITTATPAAAAAASVWHNNAILFPAAVAAGGGQDWRRDYLLPSFLHHHHHHHDQKGEGSWNVAWDARPARWLHRLDFAWLLFGVCACLAPAIDWTELSLAPAPVDGMEEDEKVVVEVSEHGGVKSDETSSEYGGSPGYRVTGVPADGRCLFRAIAHGACLQSGEEAPDENRQRELADELRAKVVEELLKRRKETEWFIEGDFDTYVKRIQLPFVWGGEPELLMASHVLMTPISVYMKDRSTGTLTKIANYGEEYQKDQVFPINVLFHGYGHYDILETPLNQSSS